MKHLRPFTIPEARAVGLPSQTLTQSKTFNNKESTTDSSNPNQRRVINSRKRRLNNRDTIHLNNKETTAANVFEMVGHQGHHDKILYLNLIIHNVSEAVKARVTKKLERAVMIPNAVKVQAAQRAGNLTSPKYVAQALSQTLCKKFPEKLQKQGVTVQIEEVFRENTFVVLQLRIIHVNPLTMMASSWTESGLSWLLESMGPSNRKMVEDYYLPNMVTSLLAATVPKMLEDKMSDKKIEAETKISRSGEQSIYFYKKLKELRNTDQWDQRMNLNPIKTIYKRMSSSNSAVQEDEEESLAATSASSTSWSFTL